MQAITGDHNNHVFDIVESHTTSTGRCRGSGSLPEASIRTGSTTAGTGRRRSGLRPDPRKLEFVQIRKIDAFVIYEGILAQEHHIAPHFACAFGCGGGGVLAARLGRSRGRRGTVFYLTKPWESVQDHF